jgi:hypothetical protein
MTEINESVPNNVMFDWLIDWMGLYLSENQVFVSVDLKYKERCLLVNRFQWRSSYMHNFVKKIVENQNPQNIHTFS